MKKKHHSKHHMMHGAEHSAHSGKGGVEVIGKDKMKKMTHHLGKASMYHEKAMHHTKEAHALSGEMPSPGYKGPKVLKSRMQG